MPDIGGRWAPGLHGRRRICTRARVDLRERDHLSTMDDDDHAAPGPLGCAYAGGVHDGSGLTEECWASAIAHVMAA